MLLFLCLVVTAVDVVFVAVSAIVVVDFVNVSVAVYVIVGVVAVVALDDLCCCFRIVC